MFDIFPQKYALFCRDRRLRTFLKVIKFFWQLTCSKRGGGGSKAVYKVKKKLHLLVWDGFPEAPSGSPVEAHCIDS